MMASGFRSLLCVLVLVTPACVVRLSDRYAPAENGAVTGEPADCSGVTPPGGGAPGGNAEIKFVGRFDMRDPQKPEFDLSGNNISARFEGSSAKVRLTALDQDVQFLAKIDDRAPVEFMVERRRDPRTGTPVPTEVVLAEDLGPGPHEILVHRNTEAQNGPTQFLGFDFGAGGRLLPPIRRPRQIEIIGDSITCGYGNEGQNATCPYDVVVRVDEAGKEVRVPVTQNQYLAYGSIAGRTLDADVTTVCWSGKGVEFNYREPLEGAAALDATTTIPMIWRERTVAGRRPPEGVAWDFSRDPEFQVVVINLGTNDFTRDVLINATGERVTDPKGYDNIPDGTIKLESFRDTYRDFVRDVRARRPGAHIFLTVPPMVSNQFPLDNARQNLTNTLKSIVAELNAAGDAKLYAMELLEQGTRYGLGCDYHPNLHVHEIMAEQVVGAIRSKTCW